MKAVNHALVAELLADESLSYKEIARQASCSDFSVRTIARKLSGDDRPMKTPRIKSDNEGANRNSLALLQRQKCWSRGAPSRSFLWVSLP